LSKAAPVVNAVAGGWSVNGIASFMTGNWFAVTVSGDRANVGGFPYQRANRTCDGNYGRGQRTIDRYFDTSCFQVTPLGTFGNSGRNIVEIPGINNWDISFAKEFPSMSAFACSSGPSSSISSTTLSSASPTSACRAISSVRFAARVTRGFRNSR
jgi:hypothetical protein